MRRVSALIIIPATIFLNYLTAALPAQAEPLRPNSLRRSPSSGLEDPASNDNRPTPNSVPVSPDNSIPTQAAFKYRLIIQSNSDSLLRQVKRIIPDAFRTTIDGRSVIQAGLFVERGEAEDVERQLSRLDVATSILELDRPILRRPTLESGLGSGSGSGSASNQRTGFSYRLVVQGSSDSLLRQVRQITPDAFRTTLNGQDIIQAGLFVERGEAEDVQRQLSRLNAQTNIFDIGYGVVSQRSSLARILPPVRDGRVVVVIDPGHGGRDVGAVGIGGIQEASIALDIAQQVAALLEKQGIQAVLTRTDDREIDLAPRVDLAESLNANLFVGIQANSINLSRPDVNGIETYYYSSGSALASTIHNSLVSATGMKDRGIRQARFYILTKTSMPAVLVEVGFVTGQEDAVRLSSPASRSQIAAGIAQGVLRYLQQRN